MERKPIRLTEKLDQFSDYWTPRVIAELNDYQLKLAKIQGEFVWHKHEDTDEMFFVLAGEMSLDFRDSSVDLHQGEIYIVPKGIEHRPRAMSECSILLIEPAGTLNTGDTESELTAPLDHWL